MVELGRANDIARSGRGQDEQKEEEEEGNNEPQGRGGRENWGSTGLLLDFKPLKQVEHRTYR